MERVRVPSTRRTVQDRRFGGERASGRAIRRQAERGERGGLNWGKGEKGRPNEEVESSKTNELKEAEEKKSGRKKKKGTRASEVERWE